MAGPRGHAHGGDAEPRPPSLSSPPPRAPRAYIVDDLSTGSHRYFWKTDALLNRGTVVVGTCSGLICLCDNRPKPDGAVTLINPVTGERLPC
ncbi:hypothetical protein D1007_22294 [Hordeum vulgare]|nr:hypothetical protein D1007_22294 [Hordeum vulgare]